MWTKKRCLPLDAWIAGNAGGILKGGGGKNSGGPETEDITTRSPLSIVSTGASLASK